MNDLRIRHNYWAILVASLIYFFLGAVWFTALMKPWLEGIDRTKEWLMSHSIYGPVGPYVIALAAAVVIAFALSCVIQLTGPQTAMRGVKVAVLIWIGFVLTTWATEYVFEARGLEILAINSGYPLVGMVLEGTILGAWKRK